jgi:hypothetical protein
MPEKPTQPNQPLEFAESLLGGSLTIFGRLVSVASLRDPKSGQYRHTLINRLLDEQSLQDTLYRLHRKYFVEWLGLTLAQQRGDLTRFFNTGDADSSSSVLVWLDHHLYRSLMPADAPSYERELFTHDVWLVLQSIQYDFEPRKTHYELDTAGAGSSGERGAPEKRPSGLLQGWKKRQWSTS